MILNYNITNLNYNIFSLFQGMEGGLEKLQTLEDSMIRRKETEVEEKRGKAPVFTVPLSNIENLREGENAHFEARLTPTDDPNLKVKKQSKILLASKSSIFNV